MLPYGPDRPPRDNLAVSFLRNKFLPFIHSVCVNHRKASGLSPFNIHTYGWVRSEYQAIRMMTTRDGTHYSLVYLIRMDMPVVP